MDEKAKKQTTIIAVLLVILVLTGANMMRSIGFFGSTEGSSQAAKPAVVSVPAVSPVSKAALKPTVRTARYTSEPGARLYSALHMRDPFAKLLPKQKEITPEKHNEIIKQKRMKEEVFEERLSRLVIQGMVWGKVSPKAIINNQLYAVGDEIMGSRIIAIDRRGVSIQRENGELRLITTSSMLSH